jgi:hypothetical protein
VDFDARAGNPVQAESGRVAAPGQCQGVVGHFSREGVKATRAEVLAVRDSFEQLHADAKVKWLQDAGRPKPPSGGWRRAFVTCIWPRTVFSRRRS